MTRVSWNSYDWRTILQLANDQVGIAEIIRGEDTHAKNQTAFDLPSRLIAKIFLFRTIFRGSGWSFANDPDFMHVSSSSKFWDGMNEKFYAKYKGIDKCHDRWKDIVVSGRPIEGPLGRSWTIPMGRDYKGELKVPLTTLSNYPVQGTGADVMMLARIMAYKRIKKEKIPCDFRSTVHDSICVDAQSCYAQPLTNLFAQVFDDLPKEIHKVFGYNWIVPMTCETKGGPNMKDQKKILRNDK